VLAAVAARLEETGADALYGDLDYVAADGTGRVVRRWRSGEMGPRSFLRGWMPPHPTFFLAQSVYDEHGVYSLNLRSAADYELMLRMLHKHRIRAAYIPDVLVKMQTGGMSNASWTNRLRANREDRAAWRMNGLRPMPWTLVIKPLRKLGQWIG
jgi:glycosyltransferase